MTALPNKKYISPEEYLVAEREALEKHEYLKGEVFAMAGAKAANVEICSNLNISLGSQVRNKDCRSYQSDLRTHIPKTGLYTYPDIIVVCGNLSWFQTATWTRFSIPLSSSKSFLPAQLNMTAEQSSITIKLSIRSKNTFLFGRKRSGLLGTRVLTTIAGY